MEKSKRLMFNHLKTLYYAMCHHPWHVAMRRHWMGERHQRRLVAERKLDPDANTRSTPPEDEKIKLVCLWAVEYYSPAYTDDLVTGLRNLGWDEPDFFSDPILGLEEMRERHTGGRMTHLGYLIPKESTRFSGPMTRVARLPEWVDYAIADLYTVTPSLNCVVVCFVLEEGSAFRFDRALRANYRTEGRTRKGWMALSTSRSPKERANC